jgi:hypothetical protein
MNRRYFLYTIPAFSACGRRGTANSIEGRWEGKLTNGASSMNVNFDFQEKPGKSMDFRISCRDLFLMTHSVQTWKLEGSAFSFTLPLVEGPRTYSGRFGGPTFDVEYKPAEEKMHLRRLGRIPSQPYQENGPVDMIPTQRSSRAQAQIFGRNEALAHYNADLLARLGISTSAKPSPKSGWVFTEDMPIPEPPKTGGPEFVMLLSPGYERIPQIAAFQCPIFVLLGEADTRNEKLERGTRQIAFDLREALTKQKRKDYQISVIPKADQTFRVPGYGREYPRLSPFHLDHFRRFLARFEPTGSSPRVG